MADDPVWEEYKILQSKIDKASDYRFTVRGWSATIILGLLLGSSAADAPKYVLLFPLPIIFLFFLMEEQQNTVQNTLQKRALSLERILQKEGKTYIDPNRFAEPIGPVPGIATALNRAGRSASGRKRWAQRSAKLFYSIQFFLVIAAIVLAFLLPARKKDLPQNVYYFNSADAPQATEPANGKLDDERTKSESGKPPKRQKKAGEASEKNQPR